MVLSDVDDLSSVEEETEQQKEDTRLRIFELFKIFDEDSDGCLEAVEVGHVLRCLRFNPSQSDVELLCDQTPKVNDVIPFENLYPRIMSAMANDEWPMDREEDIERAFETITDDRFINKDTFLQILTTIGEPLIAAEVKQLLSHLAVRRGGDIDWRAHLRDMLKYTRQID